MNQFKKNLASLPSVENIRRLELFDVDQLTPVHIIENKPGKTGSVAVYYFLKLNYGDLNATSAKAGLEIFAEHVAGAKESPGAHPNIDLLFNVMKNNQILSIQVITS